MNEKLIIAGPCSVESPEQLIRIARELDPQIVSYFRGGIWKPRTRPGSYEGVGAIGLEWFTRIKQQFGFKLMTEVATTEQVEHTLNAGVDALWIGARTSVNPFYVQQIADALAGVEIPVFVKNPINPDLSLWIGAIERIQKSIRGETAAIHRGFSSFRKYKYRNQPQWTIPISLMQHMPHITLLCDPSHIAGARAVVSEVAQQAFDLQFDGLMVEVHDDPQNALSDSAQQLTPQDFNRMLERLTVPDKEISSQLLNHQMGQLRGEIDDLDEKLIALLAQRMNLSSAIGDIKATENISILQPERWKWIVTRAQALASKGNLSDEFITALFNVIHEESINRQVDVIHRTVSKD